MDIGHSVARQVRTVKNGAAAEDDQRRGATAAAASVDVITGMTSKEIRRSGGFRPEEPDLLISLCLLFKPYASAWPTVDA
jgi:hypothetical protein